MVRAAVRPPAMGCMLTVARNGGARAQATVLGTLLLVPLTLAALNLPKVWGIYEYDVAAFPLP